MKKIISVFIVLIILCSLCVSNVSLAATHRAYGSISDKGTQILDIKVKEWLSGITKDMTTYEKALYAYLKLICNCSYNMDEKESSIAYGAIINGYAQCSGFADAYSYLLDKIKIPNRVVVSNARDHAWNLVKMDNGKWYHCDPTNGKRDFFLIGNKTLYKSDYGGEKLKNWYIDDGRTKVKASDTDYNGAKVMIHKYRDVVAHDGWFYYTENKYYTSAEKKMYNIYDYFDLYGYLKKARGGKSYTVTEPSELLKQTNGNGLSDIGTVCGDTIYFYTSGRCYEPTTEVVDTYNISTGKLGKYTAVLKKEYFSPSATGLGHTYLKVACHNTVLQDIAPTYSNYGTKGHRVCKDCGERITPGARVKPLKIKSKPTVKYSTAKKGKVMLNFANKYYKETSANSQYIKSGGYQIQYRKKESKKWVTVTNFSSLKTASKTFKLKSRSTYYFRVRYSTIIGDDEYFNPIKQYGPWSKVKTTKVK